MNSGKTAFALIIIIVLAQVPSIASGSPSCSPVHYAVSYSSPIWTMRMILNSESPLGTVWFAGFWTYEGNPSAFESLLNHTDRLPTSTDRVTVMDRDSNMNLSDGDELLFWEENASHESEEYRTFSLHWGNPWTGFSEDTGLALHDGFVATCDRAWDSETMGLIFFTSAMIVVGFLTLIAVGLRRSRRRQR